MSKSCCARMLELVYRFTPGMLFFQSYIFTYNFSSYDDVMDTRRPLLDGLAILTFLFTAIAIYKSYSPCYRDRPRGTSYSCPSKHVQGTVIDNHITTNDPYIQKKPLVPNDDSLPYPQVVYTDTYHCNQTEKQCDNVNFQLTNQHQPNKQLIENQQSNENHPKKLHISKPANHNEVSSQVSNKSAESLMLSREERWTAVWDLSSVVILLIDILVINVGVTNLWVFVKYYHLYYWSFRTPVDLLQTMVIPVLVVCIEVTVSVSRTLNTVFQIVEQSRDSSSTDDLKDDKPCNEKHLVVIQM